MAEIKCDFCSSTKVMWDYRCQSFAAPPIAGPLAGFSVEDWAACDPCRDLIEAGNWQGLVDRTLEAVWNGRLKDDPEARAYVYALHQRFQAHRIGEATAYG